MIPAPLTTSKRLSRQTSSSVPMKAREFLVGQVLVLVVFATFLGFSTAYLRSTLCIEGGTVIGFPMYFLAHCYASVPGGALGPAQFVLASLLFDVVFWYLLSTALILVGLAVYRRLRVRSTP